MTITAITAFLTAGLVLSYAVWSKRVNEHFTPADAFLIKGIGALAAGAVLVGLLQTVLNLVGGS